MKLLILFFRLLRYRVAMMLLFFFLFGVVRHTKQLSFSWNYLLAGLALLTSYVTATTLNDIADQKIDRINHPGNRGRPLVTSEATNQEMYYLYVICAIATLTASLVISLQAAVIAATALLINYCYSFPPLKLSFRTYLAPLTLTVAYVVLPYLLGTVVAGGVLNRNDSVFLLALLFLFYGRMLLKDFRDRKGDAKFGKPTFLLRFGKDTTCLVSFLAVLSGNILLFWALPFANQLLLLILEFYFLAIYLMGYKLWQEKDVLWEQGAIGLGAKMGNGVLLTVLGLHVLWQYNAPLSDQILFTAIITGVSLTSFIYLIGKPNYALEGYKG